MCDILVLEHFKAEEKERKEVACVDLMLEME